MMMCTFSSWADYHPRARCRGSDPISTQPAFFMTARENSAGLRRAGRGTAEISALPVVQFQRFAVQGWCVWQEGEAGRGEVTRVTAGEQLRSALLNTTVLGLKLACGGLCHGTSHILSSCGAVTVQTDQISGYTTPWNVLGTLGMAESWDVHQHCGQHCPLS